MYNFHNNRREATFSWTGPFKPLPEPFAAKVRPGLWPQEMNECLLHVVRPVLRWVLQAGNMLVPKGELGIHTIA